MKQTMKRNRIKLFIIFAVFLGPLLAAFIGYYGFDGFDGLRAPRDGTNHAPLISPAVPLQSFSNAAIDSTPFTLADLKHRWSVVHLLTEHCDQHCEKSLYNTRQTRLAVGKNANRIQRILISPNQALLNRLAPNHPGTIRLLSSRTTPANGLENQLSAALKHRTIGINDALLIDPLGNLMMIIPADLDPGLLLKDLKHLLRVSRIG